MNGHGMGISINAMDLAIEEGQRREAALKHQHLALGLALERLGGSIEVPVEELGRRTAEEFEILTTVRTKGDGSQVVVVELRKPAALTG